MRASESRRMGTLVGILVIGVFAASSLFAGPEVAASEEEPAAMKPGALTSLVSGANLRALSAQFFPGFVWQQEMVMAYWGRRVRLYDQNTETSAELTIGVYHSADEAKTMGRFHRDSISERVEVSDAVAQGFGEPGYCWVSGRDRSYTAAFVQQNVFVGVSLSGKDVRQFGQLTAKGINRDILAGPSTAEGTGFEFAGGGPARLINDASIPSKLQVGETKIIEVELAPDNRGKTALDIFSRPGIVRGRADADRRIPIRAEATGHYDINVVAVAENCVVQIWRGETTVTDAAARETE